MPLPAVGFVLERMNGMTVIRDLTLAAAQSSLRPDQHVILLVLFVVCKIGVRPPPIV